MNYTENYHLPQWDETDRIMRADFNRMCADMEAGLLKTARDAAEDTAQTSASAAADAAKAAADAAKAQTTADKAVADAAAAQAKALRNRDLYGDERGADGYGRIPAKFSHHLLSPQPGCPYVHPGRWKGDQFGAATVYRYGI